MSRPSPHGRDDSRANPSATSRSPTSLDAAQLRSLSALGRTVRFADGARIFREGEISGRVILLVRGRVKVFSSTKDGRDIVLAIRGPGEMLGEISAIDGGPHSATCEAMEPVEALAIASEVFRGFLKAHPQVPLLLMRTITSRLRDADRKRVEFGGQDTLGRVAARLIELAEQHGSDDAGRVRIDLAFSQQELAGWVSASRESVVKALTVMRSRGWIETRRRRIVVLNLPAIRERAT
jgi:CRP/FNR family transcriptional regulator, cyclic AMP receptor protein